MYFLAKIADVVQIYPREFHKSGIKAIEDYVNKKYADKVIHKVGLCVGFHSLVTASEGLIGHGTGIVNVNVDFRIIVWRPFRGEILKATIMDYNVNGIYLTTGFFEDIVVPPGALFEGTTFEKDDQESSGDASVFVWRPDDGQGGTNDFFFDRAEKVLFRVEHEEWTDLAPQMQRPQDFDPEAVDQFGLKTSPFRIVGSMMFVGLGPVLWWLGDEALSQEEATEQSGSAVTNGEDVDMARL